MLWQKHEARSIAPLGGWKDAQLQALRSGPRGVNGTNCLAKLTGFRRALGMEANCVSRGTAFLGHLWIAEDVLVRLELHVHSNEFLVHDSEPSAGSAGRLRIYDQGLSTLEAQASLHLSGGQETEELFLQALKMAQSFNLGECPLQFWVDFDALNAVTCWKQATQIMQQEGFLGFPIKRLLLEQTLSLTS